jgi:hypothetical protein
MQLRSTLKGAFNAAQLVLLTTAAFKAAQPAAANYGSIQRRTAR